MKHKYDFSKAERGKFYRRGAKLILPIYLDATLQKQLEPFARSQGKRIGDVVKDILKNQVQLLTTLNPSKRPKSRCSRRAPRQSRVAYPRLAKSAHLGAADRQIVRRT